MTPRAPKPRRVRIYNPAALAARLPDELRSLDGFPTPAAYLAAVGDWMRTLGSYVPSFEEMRHGAEPAVSPSDVAEAAGVPAVPAHFKHWLAGPS